MTNKVLIVYFSASGNTEYIAKMLAEKRSADIEKLSPKKEMNISGIGYLGWGIRQLALKEERELEPLSYNVADYDLIIVGTPVWSYTLTPPIRTFLKQNDFNGKDIAFFCCHGGNYAHTLDDMKAMVPNSHVVGTIDFKNALEYDKETVESQVETWLESLM